MCEDCKKGGKKLNRELREICERGGAGIIGFLDYWIGGRATGGAEAGQTTWRQEASQRQDIRVNPGCSGLFRPKKFIL
jgi:hypothetical protein